MTKILTLCADDFGQAPHISQAILTLAQEGRISAISCLTTDNDWLESGLLLKEFKNHLDIGLHFNLTEGRNSSYHPPSWWLVRAFTGKIDKTFVEIQLNSQLDRFEEVLGFPPDFIDGHQHIHSFPFIREVLIRVIHKRFPEKPPYVRSLVPMLWGGDAKGKSLILQASACRFAHSLDKAQIPHNSYFGGVYSLRAQAPYREYMRIWLSQAKPHTLLMCHPGKQPLSPTEDPIEAARVAEYTYLLSPTFQEDLDQAGLTLGRLRN